MLTGANIKSSGPTIMDRPARDFLLREDDELLEMVQTIVISGMLE